MTGRRRLVAQAALTTLALGLLAIPVAAVAVSGAATADALWSALRLAGLEAFTLIFINIVVGAFRPLFNRVVRPPAVHRLHVATGVAGFALAVAHGIMLLVFGLAGYDRALVWIGPAVLAVLLIAILFGVARRRFRTSWRWLHRLNYLVFAAVLVHALALGFDFEAVAWLRIWFFVCTAVVAAGLVYRLGKRYSGVGP